MALKMAELVRETGVPKSTILYYLKEGLLPPPEKPKPNVHYYRDETVELVRQVKYLQSELGWSIETIKEFMREHEGDFNDPATVAAILERLTGGSGQKCYDKAAYLEATGLTGEEFDLLMGKGVIVPLGDHGFDEKDVEMGRLMKMVKRGHPRPAECEEEMTLFEMYADCAKKLAEREIAERKQILEETPAEFRSQVNRLLYEIPMTLKPYILQRYTIRALRGLDDGKKE